MTVLVNGHIEALPETQTLAELLLILNPSKPFAVVRNEEFIPSEDYSHCRIYPGDRIDIVHPAAGG